MAQSASMVAAFALSAWTLWVAEHGLASLISLAAGFALVLARLRQARADHDARLGLADDLGLAQLLLDRGAFRQALSIARRVAEQARLIRTQRCALETIAWCELALGRPNRARDALSWAPPESLDVLCRAAVADACGNAPFALHLLESAAKRGPLEREARRFWIDLCARQRGVEAACLLTLQQLESLQPDDAERVLEFARCHPSPAARALAAALLRARAASPA